MFEKSATRFSKLPARLAGMALAASMALAGVASPDAQAQDKDPIRIGFSMALTGGLAAAGKSALIAMQIWEKDINQAGGLLGRPVELVYYDDQTNPATVPGIYTKLLEVDDVDLVVSGYATNMIVPAMPIVMQRGKVFLSLFGLGVNEEFKYDRYFGIMPAGPEPRTDWSRAWFELAREKGLEKIAIVAADAEFAQNAAEGARKNAEELGLEVVYDQSYPPSTPDFSPILRAINATDPDGVYVASYPPDSAGMVRALNEVGLADSTKMFGGGMVGLQFASLLENLGEKLNGIVNYDFYVPEPTVNNPGIEKFLAQYQPRAKEAGVDELGYYLPPWAYAYVQVLGQAIEGTQSLDDEKLAAYIHENEFDTIAGKVKFGETGEWNESRVLFVQFQDVEGQSLEQFEKPGTRKILKPEDFATGEWKPYSELAQ